MSINKFVQYKQYEYMCILINCDLADTSIWSDFHCVCCLYFISSCIPRVLNPWPWHDCLSFKMVTQQMKVSLCIQIKQTMATFRKAY